MSKTPDQIEIGNRLKLARSRMFSTAAEAAQALNMKAVTLRAHENGQNAISVYDLERYARRFNVSIQWLLTGSGDLQPDPELHVEVGEMIRIRGTIEADRWRPLDEDPHETRKRWLAPNGIDERVNYTDPRFPLEMVEAFRVRGADPLGHYIDGTILFCIDVSDTGFQDGDHVLVIRERGDFQNVSVRRVAHTPGLETRYESLTDPNAEVVISRATDKEELPHVSAVVIGSLTRRPVRTMDLDTIKQFNEYEKSRYWGPKDWKKAEKEAQELVEGRIDIDQSEYFESLKDAKSWLEMI